MIGRNGFKSLICRAQDIQGRPSGDCRCVYVSFSSRPVLASSPSAPFHHLLLAFRVKDVKGRVLGAGNTLCVYALLPRPLERSDHHSESYVRNSDVHLPLTPRLVE